MEAKDTVMNSELFVEKQEAYMKEHKLQHFPLNGEARDDCNRQAQAELSFKAGVKEGREEALRLALKAINDEPEFPSDMPDQLWKELSGNREIALLCMRGSVRLTKKGIKERLEAKLKEWGINKNAP